MTIVNDRTITPPIHDPELDRRVKAAGASKTVYALVTPETEAAKNFILGNAGAGRRAPPSSRTIPRRLDRQTIRLA